MRKELLATPLWRLELNAGDAVAFLARSNEPASPGELRAQSQRMIESLTLARQARGLVVDLRLGRPCADPGFEFTIRTLLRESQRIFPRVVVLVRTAVGLLQARRAWAMAERGLTTADAHEALQFARSAPSIGLAPTEAPRQSAIFRRFPESSVNRGGGSQASF